MNTISGNQLQNYYILLEGAVAEHVPVQLHDVQNRRISNDYLTKVLGVHRQKTVYIPGMSFGVRELLEQADDGTSTQRRFTYLALQPTHVIQLKREDFLRYIAPIEESRIATSLNLLHNFDFFREWSWSRLKSLYTLMAERLTVKGQYLFREGQSPEYFYVILEGDFVICKDFVHEEKNLSTNLADIGSSKQKVACTEAYQEFEDETIDKDSLRAQQNTLITCKTLVLDKKTRGDVWGEVELILKTDRKYDFRCISTQGRLWELHRSDFEVWLSADNALLSNMVAKSKEIFRYFDALMAQNGQTLEQSSMDQAKPSTTKIRDENQQLQNFKRISATLAVNTINTTPVKNRPRNGLTPADLAYHQQPHKSSLQQDDLQVSVESIRKNSQITVKLAGNSRTSPHNRRKNKSFVLDNQSNNARKRASASITNAESQPLCLEPIKNPPISMILKKVKRKARLSEALLQSISNEARDLKNSQQTIVQNNRSTQIEKYENQSYKSQTKYEKPEIQSPKQSQQAEKQFFMKKEVSPVRVNQQSEVQFYQNQREVKAADKMEKGTVVLEIENCVQDIDRAHFTFEELEFMRQLHRRSKTEQLILTKKMKLPQVQQGNALYLQQQLDEQDELEILERKYHAAQKQSPSAQNDINMLNQGSEKYTKTEQYQQYLPTDQKQQQQNLLPFVRQKSDNQVSQQQQTKSQNLRYSKKQQQQQQQYQQPRYRSNVTPERQRQDSSVEVDSETAIQDILVKQFQQKQLKQQQQLQQQQRFNISPFQEQRHMQSGSIPVFNPQIHQVFYLKRLFDGLERKKAILKQKMGDSDLRSRQPGKSAERILQRCSEKPTEHMRRRRDLSQTKRNTSPSPSATKRAIREISFDVLAKPEKSLNNTPSYVAQITSNLLFRRNNNETSHLAGAQTKQLYQ